MDAKPLLYGETSFWGRVPDRADPRRRRITRRFIRWAKGRYRIRNSVLVKEEVREAEDRELRRAMERAIRKARSRVIPTSRKVREVAHRIHARTGRGLKGFADSLHLAYAVVGRCRAMLTWDVNDLARDWTRRLVREVCEEQGLPVPLVGTPEEVMEWASQGII